MRMKEQKATLKGKRILFFAPAFFNYESVIRDKMKEMGAEVHLYDERSVKSAFLRALNKIVPTLFNRHSYNYFHRIFIKHKDEDFDYVVIIKSDMIPQRSLIEAKTLFKKAKLILYLYDSIKEVPGVEKKFSYYDRVLSFDRADTLIHPNIVFRPLFFSDDYVAPPGIVAYKYDVAFMGTIHADRFRILKGLIKEVEEKQLCAYWFFYLQANFMFYWYWLTKKEFKLSDKRYFTTKRKTGKEIASIVEQTRVIIDIEAPSQNGLTMRTIEMLGLKKKLATTNKDIVNYDLYDPNNICVINRENPHLPDSFADSPYKEVPDDIYNKYHISSWILDVLGLNNE